MSCLILDTSTEQCLVALTRKNQIVAQEIFPHSNRLSNFLIPRIQSLIEEHCQSLQDLIEIAIGIGPGSYTGTRIGTAVAKCMAFGLQIPLKTFPSPLAFLPEQEGTFAFVIPTRSNQLYALMGHISSSAIHQGQTFFLNVDEYNKIEKADFLICSSPELLPAKLKNKTYFLPVPNFRPLCLLLSEKEHSPLENIELLYLNTP